MSAISGWDYNTGCASFSRDHESVPAADPPGDRPEAMWSRVWSPDRQTQQGEADKALQPYARLCAGVIQKSYRCSSRATEQSCSTSTINVISINKVQELRLSCCAVVLCDILPHPGAFLVTSSSLFFSGGCALSKGSSWTKASPLLDSDGLTPFLFYACEMDGFLFVWGGCLLLC